MIFKSKIFKRLSAVFLLSIVILSVGCEKTDDDTPTADRDKFIGTWDGQSDGPGGPRNFNLIISISSSAPEQIIMDNFDGGTGKVYAVISGNSFSIPSQIVSGETIEGTGTHTGNALNFTFTIDDGQGIENRTGTATNRH